MQTMGAMKDHSTLETKRLSLLFSIFFYFLSRDKYDDDDDDE